MAPMEQRPDCAAAAADHHHKDKNNSSPSTTQQRSIIPTGRRRTTLDSPHRSDPRQAPSPSGPVPNYLKPTQSSARQTSVSAPGGYKDKKPPPILNPPANARKFAPPEQSKSAAASPTSKTSPKGLAPPAKRKPYVTSPTTKTSPKGLTPPAPSKPTGGATTSPKHPLLPAQSKPKCGATTPTKHPLPPGHSKSGTASPAKMMSPKRILPPPKPRDGASLWRKIKQSKLLAGAAGACKTTAGEPKKPHTRTRTVSMGSIEFQAKAMLPRRGGGMKAGGDKKEKEARKGQPQPQPQPPPAEEPTPKNNVKALVGAFENVISLMDETTPKDAGDDQRVGHHEAAESDQLGQHRE
ncbi:nascent polypeptide-associated complex subunit alpha, muscle-specific form-like [Zingiber officinale]|uniref:nascent polypeptide-associated complex subunit alpha, muscle-specific form-like n=1 Tax=Zingiber officinale TaxID=94328 RepID=UPI001C4AF302|nr:nascent polypeptide-associated complex subunit alpha, muscle-specific form-like [Zingiber officinale]